MVPWGMLFTMLLLQWVYNEAQALLEVKSLHPEPQGLLGVESFTILMLIAVAFLEWLCSAPSILSHCDDTERAKAGPCLCSCI